MRSEAARAWCLASALLLSALPVHADVALVSGGVSRAVLVTADHPTRVVRYAAEEMVHHVGKATGVILEVRTESEAKTGALPHIYLGDSRAVHEAGIDVEKLAAEAFVLRVKNDFVFIAGNDGGGDPLDPDTRAGTLWGVYEWLDRDLGVRWL